MKIIGVQNWICRFIRRTKIYTNNEFKMRKTVHKKKRKNSKNDDWLFQKLFFQI